MLKIIPSPSEPSTIEGVYLEPVVVEIYESKVIGLRETLERVVFLSDLHLKFDGSTRGLSFLTDVIVNIIVSDWSIDGNFTYQIEDGEIHPIPILEFFEVERPEITTWGGQTRSIFAPVILNGLYGDSPYEVQSEDGLSCLRIGSPEVS